jgi:hypothetical protein
VRNVVEPDGAAAYICADCFNYLRRVEIRAVVRRQVATLFGGLWPLREIWGAVVDWLLARAMLAAYRDKSYRGWISLARVAARIAEGRAV